MPYAYIARHYGKQFRHRQRVRVSLTGRDALVGTVLRAGHGKDPYMVRVRLDGDDRKPKEFHPTAVEILDEDVSR